MESVASSRPPFGKLLASSRLNTMDRQYLKSPSKRYAEEQGKLAARGRNVDSGAGQLDTENRSDGEDEDEETLRLQLAAIEAKLKLKKLQKNRLKATSPENPQALLPGQNTVRSTVQVPISPTKQEVSSHERRSPGRILLGIDKGLTGKDVSLKRSPLKQGKYTSMSSLPSSRSTAFGSVSSMASCATRQSSTIKSFSERMADMRQHERSRELRREDIQRQRTTRLNLDQEELDRYRTAAEAPTRIRRSLSPAKLSETRPSSVAGDETGRASERGRARLDVKKHVQDCANTHRPSSKPSADPFADDNPAENQPRKQTIPDHSSYEPFSHTHLSTRILPHTYLERTIPKSQFTHLRLPDLLRQVHSPSYELPDNVIDYVVFGIVASKSSPLDHKKAVNVSSNDPKVADNIAEERRWEDGTQNEKKFMVFKLTDLKWTVDLYLFGTALPRYHRLSPGTLVAVVNPSIMPPKRGKEDSGQFSLTLHSSDDTMLEIGTARDLGFCSALRKDGRECKEWVDKAKTEICEWHLNMQIQKTQAQRMGVNAGSNGFGNARWGERGAGSGRRQNLPVDAAVTGHSLKRQGYKFDQDSESWCYFLSTGAQPGGDGKAGGPRAPMHGLSAVELLDQDDDDPFIREGQLSRDKEEIRRKRLATRVQSREVRSQLKKARRRRPEDDSTARLPESDAPSNVPSTSLASPNTTAAPTSALSTKHVILSSDASLNGHGKRAAESVRLSPIKKTRFITANGIREAGRDSVGSRQLPHTTDDGAGAEDGDDLDIV